MITFSCCLQNMTQTCDTIRIATRILNENKFGTYRIENKLYHLLFDTEFKYINIPVIQ